MAGFSASCESCHDTRITDWRSNEFVHSTSFPLTGGHANRRCAECHGENSFAIASAVCVDCHRDDFAATMAPNHVSLDFPHGCSQCHTTSNWASDFNHQVSDFPLTGRHVETSCTECHGGGLFDGLNESCWSCHAADYEITDTPDHAEIQLPHDCQSCHTAQSWDATFEHNLDTPYELTGAHLQVGCKECHVSGILRGTPSQCVDCHLADYNGTTSPDHEATGIGTQCLDCHTTEAWDQAFDHSSTSFPLTGQHVQASCQQCHVGGVFEGTPSQCVDCHLADYDGTTSPDHEATGIGTQCLDCHATEAWDQAFDHNATAFPLTGQHVQASCQQCHVGGIFEGTPSQCVDCHLADYNGTTSPDHEATGIGTQCLDCHTTESWDQAFDHNSTSFPLTGQHVQATCQQCHVGGIFEGTPSQCIDCHLTDYNGTTSPDHEATGIGTQCLDCHTTEAWDQAFDHNATAFPLTGQHVQASCQQCHVGGVFEGTPSQCIDCHLTDYNGTTSPDHEATGIGTQCLDCHTTEAWDQAFDHNSTSFPLTGQHVQASCQQCHVGGVFEGTPSQCVDCHLADYNGTTSPDHEATGIGTQCLDCHTTEAWDQAFDHNATAFPLTGQHVQASCQQCHVGGVFEGTPSQCIDCHLTDYNGTTSPDHEATGIGTQCLDCHTTEAWDQAFDHNATAFPLTGQHVQATCQQCHVGGVFEGTPGQCVDCHLADYNGTTSPDHEATGIGTQCLDCHTTEAWDQAFDHNATAFPLTGQHVQASCQQCHVGGIFEGTPSQCVDCHLADYNGTTSPDHEATGIGTQCLDCHTTEAWDQAFDHNATAFPLTGQHVQASCQQCHVGGIFEGTPSQCMDCHLADYNGTTSPDHEATGIGTQCLDCHTTESWDQAFDHNSTSFPLTGQHVQATCQQCHVGGIFEGTPSQCFDCHLADYDGTTSPDHEATGIGTQCLDCHTTESWDQAFDHNSTSFPLTGQHVQATCQQCHVGGIFEGTPSQCIDCHLADYNGTTSPDHEATGIGSQCLDCHTTEAWDQAFDHNATAFPLTGQHVQASCQQCHVGGVFEGTPSQCIDCHLTDYNGTTSPDHEATGIGTQCLDCHTTESWDQAFDHNSTSFPLTGQHVQASCQQCHVGGVFEGTPSQCVDCHLADYNGTTSPDHEATGIGTQCLDCHTTEAWDQAFDHNATAFPLTGQHVQASCQQCHVGGVFEGTPSQCIDCHLADYNGTTSPDHEAAQFPTTCQTCHSTSNWNSTFNHNSTQFPLTGQHVTATCQQCHSSGQYDGLPTTCVSCHLADYNGTDDPDHEAAGFPNQCQTCHTTSNWDATFNHSSTQFPLTGQHVTATCQQCHSSGQYDGLPTTCVSCHLADYTGTDDPDHEAAQFPTTCQTCHSTSNWTRRLTTTARSSR
ncbi:MAG: hypothetical protein IPH10_08810 [bacterium]|nr:hypothetical protein [bacterium]